MDDCRFIHLFLQGLLGNLVLYILAGNREVLRDEIMYLAHHPDQFPTQDEILERKPCVLMMECVMHSLFSCSQKAYVCSTFADDVDSEIALGKLCYKYQSMTKFMKHVISHSLEYLDQNLSPDYLLFCPSHSLDCIIDEDFWYHAAFNPDDGPRTQSIPDQQVWSSLIPSMHGLKMYNSIMWCMFWRLYNGLIGCNVAFSSMRTTWRWRRERMNFTRQWEDCLVNWIIFQLTRIITKFSTDHWNLEFVDYYSFCSFILQTCQPSLLLWIQAFSCYSILLILVDN